LKQGGAFNIAIINETLLQLIHREIMDKKQAESIDEVSSFLNLCGEFNSSLLSFIL